MRYNIANMNKKYIPLASTLRPLDLNTFVGQSHLLAPGLPLYQAIYTSRPHSMILWGPPGTGKTTLAKIIANKANANFISLSAVMSGVKDIRAAIANAKQSSNMTILFIDEVHRFNKSQQDAFLPFVEDGAIIFIGATTENPSFEINNALLSRVRVYVLYSLTTDELMTILNNALIYITQELSDYKINISKELLSKIAIAADGDARKALTIFSLVIEQGKQEAKDYGIQVNTSILTKVLTEETRLFDKGGDSFYNQISALHKSVRGSSPDAALYWFARMLDGGCDPLYVARRVVRMATEDIGNADPRALQIALNAWDTQHRLGSPEGELAIAQAIVYIASTAKSNAVYTAFEAAKVDAKQYGSLPVPKHICNAPTKLMRDLDYGKGYQYDHDAPNGFAASQTYFPEDMGEKRYYYPVGRGLEIKIKEKLKSLEKTKS